MRDAITGSGTSGRVESPRFTFTWMPCAMKPSSF
jgi:hypothetical protein